MTSRRKLAEKIESSCNIGAEEVSNPDDLRVPVSLVVRPVYLEELSPTKKGGKEAGTTGFDKSDLEGILKSKKVEMTNYYNLPPSATRTLPRDFKFDLKQLTEIEMIGKQNKDKQEKHFLNKTHRMLSENDLEIDQGYWGQDKSELK